MSNRTSKTKKKAPAKRSAPAKVTTDTATDRKVLRLQAALDEANDQNAALRARASVVPGYEDLAAILNAALDQASKGKGRERHANDLPFAKQKIQTIAGLYHGPEGMLYQATKKATEANEVRKRALVSGDPKAREAYEREILGAIVYLAGSIIYVREELGE